MALNSDSGSGGNSGSTSGSEVRGAIQQGQTGDKISGFDPAASPMETDAEAGGAPSPARGDAFAAHPDKSLPTVNGSAHGSAMRPFENAEQPTMRAPLLVYIGLILAVAVMLIAGVAYWR